MILYLNVSNLGFKTNEATFGESTLEQRLKEIENVNKQLLESLKTLQQSYGTAIQQTEGKGRGKKSGQKAPSSTGSITNTFQNVQLNDLDLPDLPTTGSGFSESSSAQSVASGPSRSLRTLTTEIFEDDPETTDLFITNIDLKIMG